MEHTSISGECERKEEGVEEYTIDGHKNGPKEKNECPPHDVLEKLH